VRHGLEPRRFMTEIVRYTGEVIRCGDSTSIDGKLGDSPRCGRPVIARKRCFGCSGWREGCPLVLWREDKGHALEDDQFRQLLQRHVLLGTLGLGESGEVFRQLLENGELS
jgi:DNA topoisomerase-3